MRPYWRRSAWRKGLKRLKRSLFALVSFSCLLSLSSLAACQLFLWGIIPSVCYKKNLAGDLKSCFVSINESLRTPVMFLWSRCSSLAYVDCLLLAVAAPICEIIYVLICRVILISESLWFILSKHTRIWRRCANLSLLLWQNKAYNQVSSVGCVWRGTTCWINCFERHFCGEKQSHCPVLLLHLKTQPISSFGKSFGYSTINPFDWETLLSFLEATRPIMP